jgi:hypothetical protein
MGAYVSLLEYNGIEGMILLSELSRRRIRSITKLIKVLPYCHTVELVASKQHVHSPWCPPAAAVLCSSRRTNSGSCSEQLCSCCAAGFSWLQLQDQQRYGSCGGVQHQPANC